MKISTTFAKNALLLAALVPAASAAASGFVPAVGTLPVKYANHEACVAALEKQRADDEQMVTPPLIIGGEPSRAISLEPITNGVERKGKKIAVYAARIWSHNGSKNEESASFMISHSWEEKSSTCKGNVMTGLLQSGYTQPTFEPMENGGD